MNDLIIRSALIEKMNDTKIQIMFDLPVEELLGEDVDMDDFCTLLQDAIQEYRKLVIGEVINKTPTVEAKPVVYGGWMQAIGENYWFDYTCSICGELEEFEYNFCPNCGADMRGEKND